MISFLTMMFLIILLDYLKKDSTLDCIIGNTIMLRNNKILRNYSSKYFKSWMMYFGISPPHPSTFIKKKIYNKIGLYKSDYRIAGDFEFFLRMFYINKIKYKSVDLKCVEMEYGGKSTKSYKK